MPQETVVPEVNVTSREPTEGKTTGRPAKYSNEEQKRQANAARQAALRERRKAERAAADVGQRRELTAARQAARTIMKEALPLIRYTAQTYAQQGWLKRWPWLADLDETEAPG